MRVLSAILLGLAALWSGYWYIGKSTKFEVLETWLEDRRDAGWTVKYSDFKVVGFPNRFDSRFTDLELRDPVSGLGWKAPIFNILALSYQPNHIIAAFPNSQNLSFPLEDIAVDSTEMLASVTFEPDTLLAVDQTLLRTKDLALVGASGWRMLAQNLDLSTRQNSQTAFAHDVIFDANRVTPTRAFRSGLDPNGRLPAEIEKLFLNMVLGFDAPWDRVAIESGAPLVTSIGVTDFNATWGLLGLRATGTLDVDANGLINGKLKLEMDNWPELLELFVSAGIVARDTAKTIQSTIRLLTAGSDNPNGFKAPLILSKGQMALGPIPLGAAPRFIRR